MRSLYEASGLSRIALGLQAWPRTVLRGHARASDSDAENELLSPLAALKLWESPGLGASGRSASPFTEIAEARFAGLTAEVRAPASAAAEPAMSDPVVLLGRVPSATLAPTTIGSSTPPPAVAAICGCGYFIAPTHVLDQMAANAAHVQLSGQLLGSQVSGGADLVLTGQAGIMGASVSSRMSLQNVAPIKDWAGCQEEERSVSGRRPAKSEFCPVRLRPQRLLRLRPQRLRAPPQRHRPTFSRPRRRPQTRSFSRTRSREPHKANGISTAPAVRISKVLLPTSASITATGLTSRSIRIHQTTGSRSIASATMAAWVLERSPPSSTRACKTSPRRCATRRPAWSMPATGPSPHPGTFRRMPCPASISQNSCARTELPAKIISRSS